MYPLFKDNNHSKKGFTFVETLVYMVIFLIVVVSLYTIYGFNQRLYVTQQSVAEISQNARIIIERITREIRQARKIISVLPILDENSPSEIKFYDGHLSFVKEQGNAQGAGSGYIILSPSSSGADNYYKDFFIEIISGAGQGQIKRVYSYTGADKKAQIDVAWEVIPDQNSVYKIDTYFYYIYYYKDSNSNIQRQVYTCCFSSGQTCIQPETFVACDSTPPEGQSLMEVILDPAKVVGEFVDTIKFWGSNPVNIFLELKKDGKKIDIESKIYGRNF